jgi:hypothetical protein
MSKKNEELFDSRIVKQNLKRGLITIDEYHEYLESLEDLAEEIMPSEVKYLDQASDLENEEEQNTDQQ